MKDKLIKNIHWLIFLYALNNIYTAYDEKTIQLDNTLAQTPVIQAKIQKEKRKLLQIENFKKNLAETRKRVKEVSDEIQKLQRQLPSDVNDTEVQSLLSEIGNKLRIRDIRQAPLKEINNGFYFAKNYEFKAKGTFTQLLIFFENLQKSERILNVKSFDMDASQANTRSRFQIIEANVIVESFRYNNSYREKDVPNVKKK